MKHRILFFLIFVCFCLISSGQSISYETLKRSSILFMNERNPEIRFCGSETVPADDGTVSAYIFSFSPGGFIVISASEGIEPVYGYSTSSSLPATEKELRIFHQFVGTGIENRIAGVRFQPERIRSHIALKWKRFLEGEKRGDRFEQWPPEGTTSTGGWLETNWTQNAPYNTMCPMDLNAGARSVAGCPAIAMAQIVNYHEDLNQTGFSDSDDYYHSYGSGNQYWIDDDHEAREFPSFDSLNGWLSSLAYAYQEQLPVTSNMKAALVFGCGVAAHQVYTASVSGTFGIEQAFDAFVRFSYYDARLVYPSDTNLNRDIAENIKVALPVHLGLIVDPPGSGGHNLVVDGYNTDEFYHFNFGWGGYANGWYTLPPTSIPYNLTIIEGAILDIKSENYTGINQAVSGENTFRYYPNPVTSILYMEMNEPGERVILYDSQGCEVRSVSLESNNQALDLTGLHAGIYFFRIIKGGLNHGTGKIVKY